MMHVRIIFPISLFPSYDPLIFFPQKIITTHNSITVWDSFMKLNMSVYKVKTICHVQLISLSAPFDFVCMLVLCN